MKPINEDEAELFIEEHLRRQGWNLTDFTVTRKRWREHLDGEEADRVFFHDGEIAAILEAKRPSRDLWAALDQAKHYARTYKKNTGHDILLLFASDGNTYLRQKFSASRPPTYVVANGYWDRENYHRGRNNRETLVSWVDSSVALSRGSGSPG